MGYLFEAMNRGGSGPATPETPKNINDSKLTGIAGKLSMSSPIDEQTAELTAKLNGENTSSPTMAHESDGPLKFSSAPETAAVVEEAPPVEAPVEEASAFETESTPQIDERLVSITDPGSLISEEYRSIRTSILARWQQKRQLTHVLTSATPQEGKTFTSLNLAQCFSELTSRRTIVLEADLRLPRFTNLLQMPKNSAGLIQLLQGKVDLASAIHKVGPQGMWVIPAGGCLGNQAVQSLSSHQMAELMKVLRRKFDHVIIDTPPVTELADAGILGAMADEVLLVVRMDHTPRHLVELAIRTLNSYNAPVAGLIATHHESYRRWYFKRYGYHNYYQSKAQSQHPNTATAAVEAPIAAPKKSVETEKAPLRRAA